MTSRPCRKLSAPKWSRSPLDARVALGRGADVGLPADPGQQRLGRGAVVVGDGPSIGAAGCCQAPHPGRRSMRRSDRGPAPGPVVVSLRSRRCSCRAGTVSSRPASTSTSRAAIRYGRSCRSVRMWVSTGGPVEIVPAAACRHRHTDGERRAALRARRPYRPAHGRRGSRGPPRWPGAHRLATKGDDVIPFDARAKEAA